MTALERAIKLVNMWTSDCLFRYPDEQSTLLVERVAEAIDKAEQRGYERGRRDQAEEVEPNG